MSRYACFSADVESLAPCVCTVDVRRRNVSKEHACKASPPATKVKHMAPRTNPETILLPSVGHQFVETPCLINRVLVRLSNKGRSVPRPMESWAWQSRFVPVRSREASAAKLRQSVGDSGGRSASQRACSNLQLVRPVHSLAQGRPGIFGPFTSPSFGLVASQTICSQADCPSVPETWAKWLPASSPRRAGAGG